MLSVAEERLLERNPDARLRLYGQEINDQSYAICKSDMIAKGQDAGGSKSGSLAKALTDGKLIIVVTIQTFPFAMNEIRRLRPNVGVNDDRLGSSVVMLGDGSDGFVAGDLGGVGGS